MEGVVRRADRLFQIIQILRGARGPVTARQIADELEISVRTIYRDVAELIAQRLPICGEAGIGYVFRQGYDMPPLMLTPDEIEVAVLGAQWVAARGDPGLVRGARDLIAKINAVVPEHLCPVILESAVMAPDISELALDELDMARVRKWIRAQGKIRIWYRDRDDEDSRRVIWPIGVAYFESVRLIVAWCEMRQDFRHFRTDRVLTADFLEDTFPTPTKTLRAAWKKQEKKHNAGKSPPVRLRP